MTSQRWQHIHTLFDELIDLNADERERRLDEIGREDPEMRGELESRLQAYASADKLLPALDDMAIERSDATELLRPGNTVGHYEILGRIGQGGMGTVYRARDTRLERPVALKFLSPQFSSDDRVKQRFLREARAASALDHPNIAVVYDIGEAERMGTYIAMRYYEGTTLAEKLKGGALALDACIDLALQVSRGLEAAHEAGIVHRDIKPGNVIVTPQGTAKILDFGLAKFAVGTDLTRADSSLGTPAYMAPEQIRSEEVDRRTDLWALGVLLYEMTTGRRCFQADYEQALLYTILHSDPEPIAASRSNVPPALVHVVDRLLTKEPEERYPTAASVIEDLTAIRDGVSEAVRLPGRSADTRPTTGASFESESRPAAFDLQRAADLDYSKIWDKILAVDEEVIHEFTVSRRYTGRLSIFLSAVFVLSVLGNSVSEIFSTTSFFLVLALVYLQYYLPRTRAYALTDRRVVEHRGWLSPEVTSIPYHRIMQVRVKEPFLQRRLFDTGKIMIDVREAANPAVELNHIDHPYVIKNQIDQLSTTGGRDQSAP